MKNQPRDKTAEYRRLIDEARPLNIKRAEIGLQMADLSMEMGIDTLKANFPGAKLIRCKLLAEIKPTDFAQLAKSAVQQIKESEITPTIILADESRKMLYVATAA